MGSDLPWSVMKLGGLKIPFKVLGSFNWGYHHWCRRKRFTQRFLQASLTEDRRKLVFSVTDLSSTFLLCCPEDMAYLKGWLLSDSCWICQQQQLLFNPAWSRRLRWSYVKGFYRSQSWSCYQGTPGRWGTTEQALRCWNLGLQAQAPA